MPPVPGNKNGLKIKNPDLRQKAYKQYCEWLARGKASRSFTFEEGDLMCTGKTIESYIKENPTEFPPIYTEQAKAKGYAQWEEVVEQSAAGKNKSANTASLQMLMRNKFGWDKEEKNRDVDMAKALETLLAPVLSLQTKPLTATDIEPLKDHS